MLYISQRAALDLRCFVEVYRILPVRKDSDEDYSSMQMQLVQTIYFPSQSTENSLGNVNCAIDQEKHLMYTYSRNNDKSAKNYRECKISCFDIPNIYTEDVYLEDDDIKSSFMLGRTALYMQGGCVKNGILYIAQSFRIAGHVYIHIIDLKEQKLKDSIDLHDIGVTWEPEGCFAYNGYLMISTGKNIWQIITK